MGIYDENGLGSFENPTSVENLEGEFRNLSIEDDESDPRGGSLYPEKPDQPDCAFYMKTGTCKFGMSCRYNHPPTRRTNQGRTSLDSSEPTLENEKEELPERAGQPECKYYIKTGTCKFGKACRYHHPREKNGTGEQLELNFLGLPIRPGEKECPFYMRTGACKFATNCRFHHPDPTAVGGSDPVPGYPGSSSLPLHTPGTPIPPMTSWSMQRCSNEIGHSLDVPPSYVPVMIAPQGVMSNAGWNGYQAPINPMLPPERNSQLHPPAPPINNPAKLPDHTMMLPLEEFPERPGQPECKYFMKNGDCKFKSACRFHHPKNRVSNLPVSLNPFGLPLRPDQAICTHYSRYGICKFGAACNFDHPVNHLYPPSVPVATSATRPY